MSANSNNNEQSTDPESSSLGIVRSPITFIARLKIDQLYHYINKNWKTVKPYLDYKQIESALKEDEIRLTSKQQNGKTPKEQLELSSAFSAELFRLLSGVPKDRLSLKPSDVTRCEEIISILNKGVPCKTETRNWHGESKGYYQLVLERLLKSFTVKYKWHRPKGKDRFEWHFEGPNEINKKSVLDWTLSEILQPNLPKKFAGTNWYLYLNIRHGSQRMTLSIDETKNDEGYFSVSITESLTDPAIANSEDNTYQGTILSNTHGNRKQLILLLRHIQSETYAHLILFIEGDRHVNQTLFNGHFTYFSRKVKKYITKSVLLHLYPDSQEKMMPPKRIEEKKIHEATDVEKVIMRYLSNRKQNRLTSIGEPPLDVSTLEEWLLRHTKDPELIISYAKKYHVFYIKRRTKPVERIEFFRDELELSCSPFPQDLKAEYSHFSSERSYDLNFERKAGRSYDGRVNYSTLYLYGLLASNDNFPLYLSIHIPGKDDGVNEYFLGSITAQADGETVSVTYTCMLVPFSILNGRPNNAREDIEKIEATLKNEAVKGWGMVDPPAEIARKYKLSDLLHLGSVE